MKRFLIIAAAVAAMVACTEVSPDQGPDRKITFEVASYTPATRAHSLTSESISSFKCKAYMHGVGVSGAQDFFGAAGETISYDSTVPEWHPSHDYYWPKSSDSYVNFFSWYDTGAGPTTVTEGTMVWTNRTIGIGDNIMYADPAWRFTDNTSQASQYTGDDVTTGVPTLFHHALAQVNFKAYASKTSVSSLCSWTIVVENVAITNVYNQGTLSLAIDDPGTAHTTTPWKAANKTDDPAWTTTGSTASLTPADLTVTATTSGTAQTLLANQSVLPQALTNVHLTFDLNITTTYTAGQSNQEIIPIDIPLATAAPSGFGTAAWALNTKYTYTIKIDPSERRVLFDPAVEEEWAEVAVTEKEI